MKRLKKVGAIVLGILLSVKTFAIKAYANTIERKACMECVYGVQTPKSEISVKSNVFPIFLKIIIPIIFLIGLIIFFTKSTCSILKKVFVTLGIIIIYIVFMIIMENF